MADSISVVYNIIILINLLLLLKLMYGRSTHLHTELIKKGYIYNFNG